MIIFLYGQDGFRSRQKLNQLKDKYLREIDKTGSGLTVLSGVKASLADLAAAVSPASLLSKKRLIVIEEIFLNKDKTLWEKAKDYFNKQADSDNIIIFYDSSLKMKKVKSALAPLLVDAAGKDKPLNKKQAELFKFLSGQKFAYAFNVLTNLELANWIKKQTLERGGKISAKAAELLVGLVGGDSWQISNEIDKLLNYKATAKLTADPGEIEAEDVKNLVRGNFSENIFALTDALSARNRALALKLLDEQVEAGLSDGYLINMFLRQFKILLQIKQALEAGLSQRQIAAELKLHPFVMQKGLEQARNFTLAGLKNIFRRLIKLDFEVKSGRGDYLTGLNLLVAEI